MNETEICKQIVQQVFGHRPLTNLGLIDCFDQNELTLRATLWKAGGLTLQDTRFT